jgi:3-deoxy-D-manno-octulosonic-acid transferase
MGWYSVLLTLGLVVASPWWLWRMATSGRYREGLAGRMGRVPAALREAVAGRETVWVHAVSVGEVVTATRLIAALQEALPEAVVVVSTTTATGQKIARERLGGAPVFYLPLDFAWIVRRYLRVLRPRLLVLMESELWPRLIVECEPSGVPVAVVNARVSDRSYSRYMRLRRLWRPLLAKVSLFLAQGPETAGRLVAMGAPPERVKVTGNLKYDAGNPASNAMQRRLDSLCAGRRVIVAGSTLPGEEKMLLDAWETVNGQEPDTVLVLAPRHPQRFAEVEELLWKWGRQLQVFTADEIGSVIEGEMGDGAIVLLNTIGDLAAVYGLASVALVGGSLVPKGGHNPLEAARFGVPVVMGESYENFREVVEGMRAADAIRIVKQEELANTLLELLREGQAMGARGKAVFAQQSGAVGRTVEALLMLLGERVSA